MSFSRGNLCARTGSWHGVRSTNSGPHDSMCPLTPVSDSSELWRASKLREPDEDDEEQSIGFFEEDDDDGDDDDEALSRARFSSSSGFRGGEEFCHAPSM